VGGGGWVGSAVGVAAGAQATRIMVATIKIVSNLNFGLYIIVSSVMWWAYFLLEPYI
jgi:hypothetical protein